MSTCIKCSAATINGRLMCDPCLAESRELSRQRAERYSGKGGGSSQAYEPTEQEIADATAVIRARWTLEDHFQRAGVYVKCVDIQLVERSQSRRQIKALS